MHAIFRASARPLLVAIALAIGVGVVATTVDADDRVAIVGATLIDGTGRPPVADAVVVIDPPNLMAVGRRGEVSIPAGTREIDASGRYLIPGLMDANVHLVLGSSIEFIARHEGRYEELIEEAAQISLKHGLTTVFDSWGPLQPLLNVRERINRGEVPGARLFVAGNIVGFSGPFGRDFNAAAESTATKALVARINGIWEENTGPDLLWMTPDQVGQEMRKYAARGIDFLKYGASGHKEMNFLQFTPEAQRAIVEETHRAGLHVQTHTTSVESLRLALDAGVDLLQHCDVTGPVPIPDATIAAMIEKQVPCAVLPRTAQRLRIEMDMNQGRPFAKLLEMMHFNQIRLIQAGAPILLSTDAGVMDPDAAAEIKPAQAVERSTMLGEAHFLWFKAMQEKGMAPMDALLAATRDIASAYRKLDQFGTIEPGKRADLVLLESNPLDDLEHVRSITLVMKDGRVVDRDRLPLKPVLTAPREPTISTNGSR